MRKRVGAFQTRKGDLTSIIGSVLVVPRKMERPPGKTIAQEKDTKDRDITPYRMTDSNKKVR